MSFYVYSTPEGLHLRHDTDPLSVQVLDDRMAPIGATFRPTADDYDVAAAVAADRFVVGYWRGTDLGLFALRSGEHIRDFPFRKVGPLAAFDPAGRRLLLKSGSRVVSLDVETGQATAVVGVRALDRLVVCGEHAWLPSHRKDTLLRLHLASAELEPCTVPFGATLFDLRLNPRAPQLIAIDRKKRVHGIALPQLELQWSRPLTKVVGKAHVGVGQFSGDGRLFGAAAAGETNVTVVLHTATGEVVGEHPGAHYGLPHRGSAVRDASSRKGSYAVETFHLVTGVEGVAMLRDPAS